MSDDATQLRLGPPRYYVPVEIQWPWGFHGGPFRYLEVPASEKDRGPFIVEGKTGLDGQNK